jgi:hypothetical protein
MAVGLPVVGMPARYRRGVHHYGSMSWAPRGAAIQRRKARNWRVIERRLSWERHLTDATSAREYRLAQVALAPPAEELRDLAWRAWHRGAQIRERRRAMPG